MMGNLAEKMCYGFKNVVYWRLNTDKTKIPKVDGIIVFLLKTLFSLLRQRRNVTLVWYIVILVKLYAPASQRIFGIWNIPWNIPRNITEYSTEYKMEYENT